MKVFLYSTIRTISAALLGISLSFTACAEECVMSVSQPVVDFGQTQRTQLLEGTREGQRLLVGTRVVSLNLSCAESASIVLSFAGERAGDHGYRFARDGMFTLKVLSAQLDGKNVRLMIRNSEGAVSDYENQLHPGISLVPGFMNRAARGSKFSAQVEVKSYVSERDTEVRSREQWDGGGQFSINTF